MHQLKTVRFTCIAAGWGIAALGILLGAITLNVTGCRRATTTTSNQPEALKPYNEEEARVRAQQELQTDQRLTADSSQTSATTEATGSGADASMASALATPISLPRDLENVEPSIQRLIEQQVVEIKASQGLEQAAAHAELGAIYEANGLWPEAQKAFQSALTLDAENSIYRFHFAIAAYGSGDLTQSLAALEQVTEQAPDLAPAFQRMGYVYLARGEFPKAENAFRNLMRLAPNSAASHTALGDVLLRQGQLSEAAVALNRARAIDRNDRVAAFLLGTVYQRQGRQEEAQKLLRYGQGGEVRYLQDDFTAGAQRYAVTLRVRHRNALQQMAAGDTKAAIENLQAALEDDPDNVAMLNLLAGAFMREQRAREAFDLLLKAKAIDDSKPTTFINLSSWYLVAGDLPLALKHAELAIEKANWVLSAHYVRIATLIKMKRTREARIALVQALRLSPGDPQLRYYAKQLGPGPRR